MPQDLLTTKEVAEACRVSVQTVARWARDGLIESVKLPGGTWRYRRESVEAFMAPDAAVTEVA